MSGARANLTRDACAGDTIFCRVWRWSQKWPRRCGAEAFRVLFGFFWCDPFSQTSGGPFHTPLFLSRCFLFCSPSSWDWGQRRNARVFWGSCPSTFLFLVGFLGSFWKNFVFPLQEGHFRSFVVVSRRFSLASFTSLRHSLSLSLFFFLFFFFLPCFLVFFSFLVCLLLFLAFSLCFCFTKKTSDITFERYLFINYFCFFGVSCFVLSFKSLFLCFVCLSFQLCVLVNIHVFIFQRRPFLKHQVLFCALSKVIVFVEGRF